MADCGTSVAVETDVVKRRSSCSLSVMEFSVFVTKLFEFETWGEWWGLCQRGGTISLKMEHRHVQGVLAPLGSGQHCVVMHLETAEYTVALKMVSFKCPHEDIEFVETEIRMEGVLMHEIEQVCANLDCKQHIGMFFYGGDVMPWKAPMLILESYQNYVELSDLFENTFKFTDERWLELMRQALFQIVFSLAELQAVFPGFRHNDLKDNNILVYVLQPEDVYGATYMLHNSSARFIVSDVGVDTKIVDFATAHADVPRMTNANVAGNVYIDFDITAAPCPLYDLHFLFECFLLRQKRNTVSNGMSQVLEFMKDVIPDKYFKLGLMNEARRLSLGGQQELNDDPLARFRTPADVLRHPFFDCFFAGDCEMAEMAEDFDMGQPVELEEFEGLETDSELGIEVVM